MIAEFGMGNEEGELKAQSAKLKAEVRSQKSEVRGQEAEDRRQRADVSPAAGQENGWSDRIC